MGSSRIHLPTLIPLLVPETMNPHFGLLLTNGDDLDIWEYRQGVLATVFLAQRASTGQAE